MADGSYFGWPRKEAIITDRRVPFQQRSVCCKRVVSAVVYSDKFVFNTNGNYGCDVGDYIYPIVQNVVVNESYRVKAVNMIQTNSSIEIGPEFGGLLMALNAHAGNLGHYGFFIHRRGTERLRWTRDAKNLKYAPTTFNYQFHQYNAHEIGATEKAVQSGMVHNLQYPARLLQGHDDAMLRLQVVNTIKEIRNQNYSLR